MQKRIYRIITYSIIILLLCSSAFALSEKKEEEVRQLIRKGLSHYSQRDYKKAVQYFKEVIMIEPENPRARKYMDKALNRFEEYYLHMTDGRDHYMNEDYEHARESFYKAIVLNPKSSKAQMYYLQCTHPKISLSVNGGVHAPGTKPIEFKLDKSFEEPNIPEDIDLGLWGDRWRLDIIDEDNRLVTSVKGGLSFPKSVHWDGRTERGDLIPSGKYTAQFFLRAITYEDTGNELKTEKVPFIIDTMKPIAQVECTIHAFMPGDKENQPVFKLSCKDDNKIDHYEFIIRYASGRAIKTYSGKGNPPTKITWGGETDDKRVIGPGVSAEYLLLVYDSAGNQGVSRIGEIITEIKITREDKGLVMNFDNINFASGKADLGADEKNILDNVVKILHDYPREKILVEGHTDDVGEQESNLELSKQRAQAVREYLISQGINARRIDSVGYGESRPKVKGKSERARAKNRRVEIVIKD